MTALLEAAERVSNASLFIVLTVGTLQPAIIGLYK